MNDLSVMIDASPMRLGGLVSTSNRITVPHQHCTGRKYSHVVSICDVGWHGYCTDQRSIILDDYTWSCLATTSIIIEYELLDWHHRFITAFCT